jgi:predicted  nucleic acid-binding Zn-ribbon protein
VSEEGVSRPPLSLEDVSGVALALAAERDLPAMARRLREAIESWTAPSLVLCIEKDGAAPGGWRTIPELSWGALSPGTERSLARMIEEAPGSFSRPTLVRTEVSAANVRPRDNAVIPWWSGESSGYLVLRGIPRPAPPNLAESVALVCLPLWPLLHRAPPAVEPARPEGAAPADLAALRKKIDALERARAAAETDRDEAESEAAELRDRVERLERQLERAEQERRGLEAGREASGRGDAALLAQRQEELERLRRELGEAAGKASATESERVALERRHASADVERAAAMGQVAALEAEHAALRREQAALAREREEAGSALVRARTEIQTLYASIDSVQRQLQEQARQFDAGNAAAAERLAAVERAGAEASEQRDAAVRERDEARRLAAEAESRAEQAAGRARALSERWQGSVASFRDALEALRRTPFVPPTLRVSMSGAEEALGEDGKPAAPPPLGIRVLLLDRDTPGLDTLASELEAAGLDVLVAHYPEEVAFFLKTPEARRLAAAVCDVMAFRADQELAESFRAWRQDLPGLALFISFMADHPTEAERARRVPSPLTAGYLKRPLESGLVVEALVALGRRPAAKSR